ncbi:MAG: hypothetical protein ACRDRN_00815 [Sciscionella sp.]
MLADMAPELSDTGCWHGYPGADGWTSAVGGCPSWHRDIAALHEHAQAAQRDAYLAATRQLR